MKFFKYLQIDTFGIYEASGPFQIRVKAPQDVYKVCLNEMKLLFIKVDSLYDSPSIMILKKKINQSCTIWVAIILVRILTNRWDHLLLITVITAILLTARILYGAYFNKDTKSVWI